MNFPLLKIVSVPDELPQSDPLAELRLQRDELAAQLAAVSSKLARLQTVLSDEREAHAAISALGEAELKAMAEWLSSASVGLPAPKPDMETRARLNHELATAMAQAATQRQAAANLNAEHSEISSKLRQLAERLEAAAIDEIVARFTDQLAELTKLAETIRDKSARVFGAVAFLRQFAEGLMATRTDKATLLFRRLEGLAASSPNPEFSPSIGATNAAAAPWALLFRELIK
jgi:hypothetical protein